MPVRVKKSWSFFRSKKVKKVIAENGAGSLSFRPRNCCKKRQGRVSAAIERTESKIDSANGVVCRLKIELVRGSSLKIFREFKHSRQKILFVFLN